MRRFKQVDVFTDRPLAGNPVAVVLDADGLDDATMQRLAAWTNLSETTFVLPPTSTDASYRLRIFTPRSELAFAGHPTIGSAHAVLETGVAAAREGVLRQECRAGVLPIRIDGAQLMVRVPEPRIGSTPVDAGALGAMVRGSVVGTPRTVDCGPVWLVAQVADEATLRGLMPDLAAVERLSRDHGLTGGVTLFALASGAAAPVVVRSFAPAAGVPEDPVCGSGNASVGAYLADAGLLEHTGRAYRARQGREVGRDGQVDVVIGDSGRTIEIGGRAVTVIDGMLAE